MGFKCYGKYSSYSAHSYFVEHLVCSNFKTYSVLILFLLFYFGSFNRKCICKNHLFLKFQVLREGSSFIASFVEHPVCTNFKMYSVLILVFIFWFVSIYPKCVYERHLISKFQVVQEGSSDIASFVEHPVSTSFKMYSVLILVFWF